ncbi:plasma membrane calcium, partial [Tieghemiomyces parasiticus]
MESPTATSTTDTPTKSRFLRTAGELQELFDGKNVDLLIEFGGVAGLAKALDTSLDYGLIVQGDQPETSRRHSQRPTGSDSVSSAPIADILPADAAHYRGDVINTIRGQFAERIAQYGANVLPAVKIKSFWRLAWEAMQEKIIIVLAIAAVVSLGLGIYEDVSSDSDGEAKVNWVEGFAIIVAILIVILAGSVNDYQKERQFQKLNAKKDDRQIKVLRNGGPQFVSVYAVQVGDVLEIEPGDIMCADAILIRNTNGMRCDESSVTGESDPIRKHSLALTVDPATGQPQLHAVEGTDPLLISGSKVLEGLGRCLVVAVGPHSFYGKTLMSLRTENQETPLQAKLNRLAGHISKLGLAAAVLMLVVLLIRYFVHFGQHPESRGGATTIVSAIVRIVITTVTIVVVAVPEGLPLAVTLALAYATTRMVRDNCLVRVLASCETMGNATTICSDKTGTLTQNHMTVVAGTLGDNYRFARAMPRSELSLPASNPAASILGSSAGGSGSAAPSRRHRRQANHGRVHRWVRGHHGHEATSTSDPTDGLTVPDVKIVITEVDRASTRQATADGEISPSLHDHLLGDGYEDGRLSFVSDRSAASGTHSTMSGRTDGILDLSHLPHKVPGRVLALIHEAVVLNSTAFERDAKDTTPADLAKPETDEGVSSAVAGALPTSSRWNRLRHRLGRQADGAEAVPLGPMPSRPSTAGGHAADGPGFEGSKTEVALLEWAMRTGAPSVPSIRSSVETVQVWPFSSATKRMTTIVKYVRKPAGGGPADIFWRLYVKGAPELLLPHCISQLHAPANYHRALGSGQLTPTTSHSDAGSIPPSPTASFPHSPGPSWSPRSVTPQPTELADEASIPFLTVSPPAEASSSGDQSDQHRPSSTSPSLRDPTAVSPTLTSGSSHPITVPALHVPSSSNDASFGASPLAPGFNLAIPTPGSNGVSRAASEEYLSVDSAQRSLHALARGSRSASPSGTSDRSFVFPAVGSGDIPTIPLGAHEAQAIEAAIAEYSNRSLRTIGLAYREFPTYEEALFEADTDEAITQGLTWLGLFGIEDPLRPGVVESVALSRQAGVMVRMVTGDNMLTAKAIATQCGIYVPNSGGLIMEGPQFRKLSPLEMDLVVPRLQVLARSSPEDKKTLVNWLQRANEVVAVTGDGTNDGPALKSADIGFSMGIAGTEVAKEASSIILMDDNFASIVKATMWGRCVNDAVKKFLQFQLTVNITAVLLAFISAVSDSNQASILTAVQLLWVNLIMDTLAALALATDPPTVALLQRPPDKRHAALISLPMWKMIIGQAIYQIAVCLVLYYCPGIFNLHPSLNKTDDAMHRALVFNAFVFMQLFNEINARVLDDQLNVFHRIHKNYYFGVIFLLTLVLQVIIVEFGGVAFKTHHQPWYLWLTAVIIGALALPLAVVIKAVPDRWFGWLPASITDIYHHPQDLSWQNPALAVHNHISGHPLSKSRNHVSLDMHSPLTPGSTPTDEKVAPLPSPSASPLHRPVSPANGGGGFGFRRKPTSTGLTSAAVMIPTLTLTSVAVSNELARGQPTPFKDDVYVPVPLSEKSRASSEAD